MWTRDDNTSPASPVRLSSRITPVLKAIHALSICGTVVSTVICFTQPGLMAGVFGAVSSLASLLLVLWSLQVITLASVSAGEFDLLVQVLWRKTSIPYRRITDIRASRRIFRGVADLPLVTVFYRTPDGASRNTRFIGRYMGLSAWHMPPDVAWLWNRARSDLYGTWLHNWQEGRPIPLEGDISYVLQYVNAALTSSPAQAAAELTRMIEAYPAEEKLVEVCTQHLADCYVLLGDYRRALEVLSSAPIGSLNPRCADDILSLKLQTGDPVAGREILALDGRRPRRWVSEHLEQLASYLDNIVSAQERRTGGGLLEKWRSTSQAFPYIVFRGTRSSACASLPWYYFSRNKEVLKFVKQSIRDAERSLGRG
jgi:hypothetical protein